MTAPELYLDEYEVEALVREAMPAPERASWEALKHQHLVVAFVGRRFVAYRSKGTRGPGIRPPEILGGWEVTDVAIDPDDFAVELTPTGGGAPFWADMRPRRLPGLEVFVAVPTRARLTLVARRDPDGPPRRSLQFGLLIKASGAARTHYRGATYLETVNSFLSLHPAFDPQGLPCFTTTR